MRNLLNNLEILKNKLKRSFLSSGAKKIISIKRYCYLILPNAWIAGTVATEVSIRKQLKYTKSGRNTLQLQLNKHAIDKEKVIQVPTISCPVLQLR